WRLTMPTKSKSKRRTTAAKRAKAGTAARRSLATRPVRHEPETLRLRSIAPFLTVNELPRSIHFYTEGLGFVVKDRWEQDGQLGGVTLKAGDCEIMLNQDNFAKGRDRVKGVGLRLWLTTVQDVDVLAAQARANGVVLDQEPTTQPWGARAFAVTDPDG